MNPDTYIAPVYNRFLDKAERHIKYIVSTSSYVRNLQKKREVLNATKNTINGRIAEGERRSQRPTEDVVLWGNQTVDILGRIDTALNIAQETTSCVSWICSCVCWICSLHKLGHTCDDMIKEVDDLLKDAPSFPNAGPMVDCDPSNIALSMPYVLAESQDQYFAEACKCIEDNNPEANIIGIWGLGGVGKTTLLTKIHNSFVGASSMFETVIWTVASSETSNISRVQSEIVKKLRLNESDDVQSQAAVTAVIYRFLKNKNFLLFIDDLWKGVDLHKVGIPIPNEGNRCGKKHKVIFTTRSKVVCGNMEARKIIEVKCLNTTQSWTLFKEKVGMKVIQSHPGIPKLAEDIAKECQGLPLALITIGRAMSTKSNIDEWKSTLNLLKKSQGHHVSGVEEELLPVLKISYDYLTTEQLRKCFLTISLWPEDHVISTKELIDFWMGIDLIDNFDSKHELYQFGHSLIRRLQAACLLDEVEYDGDRYTGYQVKMHDVLRDLALWLASDCGKNRNKWMVKAGIQLKKAPSRSAKWKEAECISLMYNEIEELPSNIPSCPSLLTLVLRVNRLTSKSCFGMFHSLIHLDLSYCSLKSFPESICNLTKLRYLNLSSNEITNVLMELRNLKELKYLILRSNCITNIPRGVFAELVELLVLDMVDAFDTYSHPSLDVEEELKSIEKKLLSLGINVKTETELSKLMLLSELPIEDLSIEGLHSTTFHFMSMITNTHLLKELSIFDSFDGLSEIVFDKNDTDQDIVSLNLEHLALSCLSKLKRIIWKDIAPEALFVELQSVAIHSCNLLEDITWVIHLPSLKDLHIRYSQTMRIAINNDMDSQVLTFPSLQVLSLTSVDKLEKISIRSLAFPQLKQLQIKRCPLLKALPFEVETTPKLRNIKGERVWWEEVEWEDDNSRSHFNQFFRSPGDKECLENGAWDYGYSWSHFNIDYWS